VKEVHVMIEEGDYRARVEDYGVSPADSGGQHPTAFIKFKLIGRYADGGVLEECPASVRHYFKAVTANTYEWVLRDLKKVGYDREGIDGFDPEAPGAPNLFGREFDVHCTHEEYKGETKERWSVGRRPRPRKRVDRDVLAGLDAKFGKKKSGPKSGGPADSGDDAF
jgi:hypothetical protein